MTAKFEKKIENRDVKHFWDLNSTYMFFFYLANGVIERGVFLQELEIGMCVRLGPVTNSPSSATDFVDQSRFFTNLREFPS